MESPRSGNALFFTAAIDPAQPLVLSVNSTSGDITLGTDDVTQVEIEAQPVSGSRSEDGDHDDFVFDVKENHVSLRNTLQLSEQVSTLASKVKSQLKEGFKAEDWDIRKLKSAYDAKYDISIRLPRDVPAGSTISLRTASGDVSIANVSADVTLQSLSGDVTVTSLTGKVSLAGGNGDLSATSITGQLAANVANGDIAVTGFTGPCTLRSMSGDILIRESTLSGARIATVNGDISVNASLTNAAEYTCDTVNGDILLTATLPSAGAGLTVRSVSGDVKVGGDWTRTDAHTWQLAAGSDGPSLAIKTVRGDVNVNASTDAGMELTHTDLPDMTLDTVIDLDGKELSQPTEASASATASGAAPSDGGESAMPTIEIDTDRAKGWMREILTRVTNLVNDIDDAGDTHRAKRAERRTTPEYDAGMDARPAATTDVTEVLEVDLDGVASEPSAASAAPTEEITMPAAPEAVHEPNGTLGRSFTGGTPENASATEETTAQRRTRLLEAVQRGDMTVDEALAQLDANA